MCSPPARRDFRRHGETHSIMKGAVMRKTMAAVLIFGLIWIGYIA
jgi:hypothetical protein